MARPPAACCEPMKETRLLVVSRQLYPEAMGGIETFNYRFAQWLEKNSEIQPVVMTSHSGKGLEVEVVRPPMRYAGSSFLAWAHTLNDRLRQRAERIHVMLLSYAESDWREWLLYVIAGGIWRVPYVIYIHSGILSPWRPRWPYRLAFGRAGRIFCVSEIQKDEYQRRTGRAIEVLAPLMPPRESKLTRQEARFRFKMPQEAAIIAIVGSVKPLKGPDVLIEAFHRLDPTLVRRENVHAYFIGQGDSGPYAALLRSAEARERIHFFGPVPNDEIGDIYRAADIFVMPSRVEGMPVVLLEAAFHGLPSIVSDLPCLRGVRHHGEDCLKFQIGDSEALSSLMARMIGDQRLREGIGQAGARFYRLNFDGERTFRTLAESFRSLARAAG